MFIQIEPLTADVLIPNVANYEPRRRASLNRLKEPVSGRSTANATPAPQILGLNVRRLPPEAPSAIVTSSPLPAGSAPSTSQNNPFSPTTQSKAQVVLKAPPPLPPKPILTNPTTPSQDKDEVSPRSQSSNPFRQRLQSINNASPSPKPLDEIQRSTFSPPLPPRHPALDGKDKDGRHTTFTPSTKAASTVSSFSAGPSKLLNVPSNGPSGFLSYPTAPLIKEGLMAADRARSRSGSFNKSGSPSPNSMLHVIKRSGDFKLIPDSTGGSTVSSGMGDVIESQDTGVRKRSGSLLALKSNNLNPFEQGSHISSTSVSNRLPPQAPGIYVPKAPPAPPPRERQKMRLSMPLPPPRRKPSATIAPTAESMLGGVKSRGSVLARRTTLGSVSHTETSKLFAQAAAENPATDSSDDESATATEPPTRRVSGMIGTTPHRVSGSTVSTPSSIRENIGKTASDMKGEWEWLKGGRGGRWAAVTSGNGGDEEHDELRKLEKERLVNDIDD